MSSSAPPSYPLTVLQNEIFSQQQRHSELPLHNLGVWVQLDGEVDVAAMEQSVAHIVARHDALRLTLVTDTDPPVQQVQPQLLAELNYLD